MINMHVWTRVISGLSASVVLAAGTVVSTSALAWADTPSRLLATTAAPDKVSTDDDPARTFASFALRGVATDDIGRVAAGADLTVNLDPSPQMQVAAEHGADAIGFGLASTTTDSRGRFNFRIPALKNVEQYRDSRGAVRLWITGGSDTVVVSHRFEVIPPKMAQAKPVAAYVDDTVGATETDAAKRTAKAARAEMTAVSRADAGPDDEALPEAELNSINLAAHRVTSGSGAAARSTAGLAAAGDNPNTACVQSYPRKEYTNQYRFQQEGASKRSWVNVQTVHTLSKMSATYEWSNTSETRLSVGVDATYRNVKFKAAQERVAVAESGVNFTVARNQRKKLEVEWDIREYRLYCHFRDSGWTIGFYTEFRPYTFTGGNRKSDSPSSAIGCTTTVPTSDDLWVSRTTTHGSSLTVSGFSLTLDASQKNTTKHKKTFKTSVSAKLCGQGGYPTAVDKVKEVP